MGNALWKGVRLKDVLDRAGVKAGALQVRFNGLDTGLIAQTPDFMKSIDIEHARDGEVMIAYAMNGAPLPLLNGFPLRLVVPGWYAPIGSRCSTTSRCWTNRMTTSGRPRLT